MYALLLIATLSPAQQVDPLAEARGGKHLCLDPNPIKKTCTSIRRFSIKESSAFEARDTSLLNVEPPVKLEMRSDGVVEGAKVCFVVNPKDYEVSRIKINGNAPERTLERSIRDTLVNSVKTLAGRKICFSEKRDGDVSIAEVELDGQLQPALNKRYIWVSPKDGYQLGAAPPTP